MQAIESNRLRFYRELFHSWFDKGEVDSVALYVKDYPSLIFREMEFFLIPTIAKIIFDAKQSGGRDVYAMYFSNTKLLHEKLESFGILGRLCAHLRNFVLCTRSTLRRTLDALLHANLITCARDVVNVRVGLSDLHSLGFTSSLATTRDGQKFFVKQSIADPARIFYDMCDLLDVDVKKKEYVGNYHDLSITRFLPYEPNVKDARVFYRRMATLMALATALNLTDIHLENLLVHDQYPVILDFESLFTFKENQDLSDVESTLFVEQVSADFDGPIAKSFISALQGGAVRSKSFLHPFVVDDGSDNFRVSYRKLSNYESHNRIISGHRVVQPHHYLKTIISYFVKTMQGIRKNKLKILNLFSSVCLGSYRYRYILRPTAFYHFLFVRSHQPSEYMHLDAYWDKIRSKLDDVQVSHFCKSAKQEIIAYELEAIKNGLIPFFYRDSHTLNLYTIDSKVICHAFTQTLETNLVEKIHRISDRYIQENALIITKSLNKTGEIDQVARNAGWIV